MKKLFTIVVLLLIAGASLRAQLVFVEGPGKPKVGFGPRREQHSQSRLGEWLRRNKDLPPQEQQRQLDSDPQFQQLPPERQEKLRQRLKEFNSLPPQQKERVVHRMEALDNLSPEQQQRARA